MKPKQKSVTMWVIYRPYFNDIVEFSASTHRKFCWEAICSCYNRTRKELYKQGYRAVKGKFVWEEK